MPYTVKPNRSAGLNNLSCFSVFLGKLLRQLIYCKLTELLLNIELGQHTTTKPIINL